MNRKDTEAAALIGQEEPAAHPVTQILNWNMTVFANDMLS